MAETIYIHEHLFIIDYYDERYEEERKRKDGLYDVD